MKYYIYLLLVGITFNCTAQNKKETYYTGGKLKNVHSLNEEGLKEGEDIDYYRDGSIKSITLWDEGKLTDSIVKYEPYGKVYSIGYIKRDSLIFYRSDGSKEYEVALKDGKKDGEAIYFDDDGSIIGFNKFKNDLNDGFLVQLNEKNKKPKHILEIKENEADGVLINFYDNGYMKSFRSADISKDGQSISFHKNGVIKDIVITVKGEADGWKYVFDDQGKLISKIFFNKGEVVDKIIFD